MTRPNGADHDAAQRLLNWYDRNKRDLPWRRHPDPYFTWVSEIMLQQTQVATTVPYFEAFVAAFPTFRDLAAAELDQVLSLWSGLGYYRRARLLHQAARKLVENDAEIPDTVDDLLLLPGIGPYTAAAIAAIAFGRHVAVLDGNVERVMCRRLAFADDPKTAAAKRLLAAETLHLVDPERAGDSNQALMELGATICRPQSPDCPGCPLKDGCLGRSSADQLPRPRRRRKTVKVSLSVVVVHRGEDVLLFRRPENASLLAGMWELPHVVHGPDEAESDLTELCHALARDYGGRWKVGPVLKRLKHAVTHRAITLHVRRGVLEEADTEVRQRPLEAAWVSPERRADFAVSSAVSKALAAEAVERSVRKPRKAP